VCVDDSWSCLEVYEGVGMYVYVLMLECEYVLTFGCEK